MLLAHDSIFMFPTNLRLPYSSSSDVQFVCRNGADYLGPLLPAVAEICSDLQPIQDVDTSLQKLFRNLWFYIVLYGLAPPIQNTQQRTTYSRSMSSTGGTSGSLTSGGALSVFQTVSGPHSVNEECLSAVYRLTQSTPPLVSQVLLSTCPFHCIVFFFRNDLR